MANWTVVGEFIEQLMLVISWFLAVINSNLTWQLTMEQEIIVLILAVLLAVIRIELGFTSSCLFILVFIASRF